jgi:hypothetical protein
MIGYDNLGVIFLFENCLWDWINWRPSDCPKISI